MARSLAAGEIVSIESQPTLADGLAGDVDELGLDVGRHALDDLALAEESEIAGAIAWLAREERLVVEGAGAAGVAAVLAGRLALRGPTAIVITGRNIDPARHAEITSGERTP
jgi:threonine dehydratase